MKDFEKTDLSKVRKQIDDGIGFKVGDHNYGRVDRMSPEELDTVAAGLVRLIEEASELLGAIGLVSSEPLSEQSE